MDLKSKIVLIVGGDSVLANNCIKALMHKYNDEVTVVLMDPEIVKQEIIEPESIIIKAMPEVEISYIEKPKKTYSPEYSKFDKYHKKNRR